MGVGASIPAAAARTAGEARRADDWRGLWLALSAAGAPMLVPYFVGLWRRDYYQFFPLALLAVVALVRVRSDGRFGAPRGLAGWTGIAAGGILFAGSLWLGSPWLAAASYLLFGAVCLASMRGPRDASLLNLALPLAILLRPPVRYDEVLVTALQRATTRLTSVALDAFAVPHALAGNVIRLPGRGELLVAEACSGIQSVFTLAFLATLLVVGRRRPLWVAPIYLAMAAVLALGANVLRVGAVAVSESWWAIDLASGWPHAAVGYTALALAVAWLLSFDALVVALLHHVEPHRQDDFENPLWQLWNLLVPGDPGAFGEGRTWNRRPPLPLKGESGDRWPAARRWPLQHGLFVLAAGAMVVSSLQAARLIPGVGGHGFLIPKVLFSPPPRLFADTVRSVKVIGHTVTRDGENPRLGTNADLWQCRIGRHPAQLVLSQTYRGWHELCFCYETNGWRVLRRQAVVPEPAEAPSAKGAVVPVALARFDHNSRPTLVGYLFYTALTADGRAIAPPPRPGALRRRFSDTTDRQPMMMLQLWIAADAKLAPRRVKEVQADFFAIRNRIAEAMKRPREGTADGRS